MFFQDIRHSLRTLALSPGFTAIAILSVALGVGVNTAMFSFHDAILFRPLPVPDPNSMVSVGASSPDEQAFSGRMSYPNYRDLRDQSQSFEGMIADEGSLFSFGRSRQATREMRMGSFVSENFFNALRVQPMLGRGFRPEEGEVPGRNAVVVLGYDFWKNVLGSDPSILNSTVVLNGIDFQVIGVLPESFPGLDQFFRPTLYVPMAMLPRLVNTAPSQLENREQRSLQIRARLRSGVSRDAAQAEMTALWTVLRRQYPDANNNRVIAVRSEFERRLRASPPNAVFAVLNSTLASVVLIIACANVANLLLGRARTRSREVAIRLALGVGRVRLLRQFLTESLLLALLGGVFGIGLAYTSIRFMAAGAQAVVPTDVPAVVSPQLDARVLLFSLVAAVISAVLFGLAPALRSLNTDLVTGLKSSDLMDLTRRRMIGRHTLVVAQIALSMLLLVAAGMLQSGFRQILAQDPGFRTDHLMTMSLDTSFAQYTPERTHQFYRDLVERARALPDAQSVALADSIPLNRGRDSLMRLAPEGHQFPPGQDSAPIATSVVDEHYFKTVQTPVARGRGFSGADNDSSRRVAIVNEAFAATYWPNQDPIGKRIRLINKAENPWLEVVGVTKTEKYFRSFEAPTPFVYLPFAQNEKPQMSLLVATTNSDASPLAGPLRALVRDLDVNQPVFLLRTFSSFYRQQATGAPILIMRVATAMGFLGLTLALVGLYGIVSYSVARRTREIGVRMAIGAGRADVMKMVLREGMKLAISGILIGGIASIAVARLLSAGMAGLGAATSGVYVIVPVLLMALTLAASYVPAYRASRVDPLRALRYE